MYSFFTSQWFDLSMRYVEPLTNINKLTIDTTERVASKQIDMAVDYFDFLRQQSQLVIEMKGQPMSLAEQGKIVANYGNKMMQRRDEFLEIASEAKQSLKKIVTDSNNTTIGKIEPKGKVIAKAA